MDKFRAAFEILYFLSAVDGDVADKEIDIIFEFLDQNYENVDFVPSETIKSIEMLKEQGLIDEFLLAANYVKDSSDAQDRITILNFALAIIESDDEYSEGEKALFEVLCDCWDIDLKSFLDNAP